MFVELTLSFRLFVFDNDYLSYADVTLEEALTRPVILISNPPVRFLRPLHRRTRR